MIRLLILFFFIFTFFLTPISVSAQGKASPPPQINDFERGKVLKIIKQGEKKVLDTKQPYQLIEIKILTGQDRGKNFRVEHGARTTIKDYHLVKVGNEVVLSYLGSGKNKEYFIVDKYRIPSVALILVGFFALVVGFARLRGLASIVGMLVSLGILLKYIVPSIAAGSDPVSTSLIGASLIVFISIFLAHGFYKRTVIAVGATFITLLIAVGLSYVFVNFSQLSGAGSEDAFSLQFGQFANINLKGLLLGGIIIGTLGVLDDITTSLAAAVEQISKANSKLEPYELYKRGIAIGREHVTSLVNTLVLAYAGASMPLFLFFISIKDTQPLWVTLNNEMIVEEVIRALVGSTALVLAVPITTIAAALFFGNSKITSEK